MGQDFESFLNRLARGFTRVAPICMYAALAVHCSPMIKNLSSEPPPAQHHFGKTLFRGVTALTGLELKPFQTHFDIPELADPYATQLKDSVVISGTAPYYMKFPSQQAIESGGPYEIVWPKFFLHDGSPLGSRSSAPAWDLKPVTWIKEKSLKSGTSYRLWSSERGTGSATVIWYGGHMRRRPNETHARWPADNFSRDIFAFVERSPGEWMSLENSIFSNRSNWPRAIGNFLGHRYGHQIVLSPKLENGQTRYVPTVYYEEVTEVRSNGAPLVTKIFKDEMDGPFQTKGSPTELISPINQQTGQPFPSALREDGSVLVEGPLYFRFEFEGEAWEAIGFSAGSFYSDYPAIFASRKISDGLNGQPYLPDLTDDGIDFHNAGAQLGRVLNLAGGPARPAVLVDTSGKAVMTTEGHLQVLVHGYRKEILPDHDFKRPPEKYRFDQMFRVAFHTRLKVSRSQTGRLRFDLLIPDDAPSFTHTTSRESRTFVSNSP